MLCIVAFFEDVSPVDDFLTNCEVFVLLVPDCEEESGVDVELIGHFELVYLVGHFVDG